MGKIGPIARGPGSNSRSGVGILRPMPNGFNYQAQIGVGAASSIFNMSQVNASFHVQQGPEAAQTRRCRHQRSSRRRLPTTIGLPPTESVGEPRGTFTWVRRGSGKGVSTDFGLPSSKTQVSGQICSAADDSETSGKGILGTGVNREDVSSSISAGTITGSVGADTGEELRNPINSKGRRNQLRP